MENNPLVSIIVVAYNSSEYILEALNSIKCQSYNNIELIISDDCSTDDTVQICSSWIGRNKERFFNTEIVVPPKNTGTAINCNRGVLASSGSWIKLVAGDDMLPPESIQEFIYNTVTQKNEIYCCKLKPINDEIETQILFDAAYHNLYDIIDSNLSNQKKINRRKLFIPGPGVFFTRRLFNKIDGFDGRYPFADEWPFVTKVFKSGEKIFLVDKYLYNYRVHEGSMCREELGLNKRVFVDTKRYFFNKILPDMLKAGDILYAWHSCAYYWGMSIKYSYKKNSATTVISNIISNASLISLYEYIKTKKSLSNKYNLALFQFSCYRKIKNIDISNFNIIIIGAGYRGIKVSKILKSYNIRPVCFVDNNANLQGKRINKLSVHSLEKSMEIQNSYCIIAIHNKDACVAIYEQLIKSGVPDDKILGVLYSLK